MKIVVAIKQVPERDATFVITGDEKWIDEDDLAYTINEPDSYALEEALQLRDSIGAGEVVVLSAGPTRVSSTIRDALAKGADRAIHIECDDLQSLDTLGIAKLLAHAIKAEAPDLILSGLQSDDLGFGQTGVVVAELLGIPYATIIKRVEITLSGLRVTRELEDGWFQHIDMPLPALLTIQSGGNKLRYATLMGIKKAKSKSVETISADYPAGGPATTLDRVYLPEKQKKTEMLTGSVNELASQLVEKLRLVRAL